MQNFDRSNYKNLSSKTKSFSSTQLNLKQRYMQDFLEDLKKVETDKTKSTKEILFEEIKTLLSDF
jgi:hypothetical protein